MISLTDEPCCICGETKSVLVQEATYPEHGYPGSFILRRCAGCGLLFNSPRLDNAELGQLYGKNYYFFNRPDSTELSRIVPMYERTVALVKDEVLDKVTLDIGCGRGFFPAVLRGLGWKASGVEISTDAANYARKTFSLEVFTGTVEQYAGNSSAKKFPLVTAIDVIEHVPSPQSFIAALAKVVDENGLLILDTPNAAAYNINIDGPGWQGFNPFHIYLFTIPNLRRLLQQHGFVVEQSFSYNNAPHDAESWPIVRKLRQAIIDSARTVGVLKPLAKLYFNLKTLAAPKGEVHGYLNNAVERSRSSPNYLETPDAEATLAAEAAGDNIVVIARKKSAPLAGSAAAAATAIDEIDENPASATI